MKTLLILAAVAASFISEKTVSVKKMVIYEQGCPAKAILFEEPVTIGGEPTEISFELASKGKEFSAAFFEADPSVSGGIGRACSFVCGKAGETICLKDNGERLDVRGRGYYKTLFVDAGFSLNNYYSTKHFQWIKSLGLEDDYEYLQVGKKDSTASVAIQNGVMVSAPTGEIDWKDDNGALLYPDGAPRFRLFYANGGSSSKHGATLTDKGRYQINGFFKRGGSYVGTCAGGFLGCVSSRKGNRYDNDDPEISNYTFGFYPGAMIGTSVPINIRKYPSVYLCHDLTERFKEIGLKYGYNFADTVERVRHHGGGYMKPSDIENYPGAEILAYYNYTRQAPEDSCSYTEANRLTRKMHGKGSKSGVRKSVVGKVCTFAWKENECSGRAVLCGSHPEKEPRGSSKHDFFCTMALYALEGNGAPEIKSELQPGKTYKAPVGVGDLQYHHFTFTAAEEMKNVKIALSGKGSADLYLTLRGGDFAWLSEADYMVCSEGGKKTIVIDTLPAGTWYIGVFCATTVKTTVESQGKAYNYFYYLDKAGVLNGIDYSLTVK